MKPGQGLFPESLLHLGGDEVNTACWKTTPSIAAWLAARNMTQDDGYGKKTVSFFALKMQMAVLPRQTWDKHRETPLKLFM